MTETMSGGLEGLRAMTAGPVIAPDEAGPIVQLGLFFWPPEQRVEALRLMRDVVAELPRSMNAVPAAALDAPPAPFVPPEHHHRPGCALLLTGFGDPADHEPVVDRIRSTLPPLFDHVGPIPYVELQQLLDEANAWGTTLTTSSATTPTSRERHRSVRPMSSRGPVGRNGR